MEQNDQQYIIVQTRFCPETGMPLYQIARRIQGLKPVYSVSLGISGNEPVSFSEAKAALNVLQPRSLKG